ncbi:MAG: flagellin [Bacillus sp. (in: Bacteria)]|nr:flagellin [Bacillus sp. (in: firmicutes)]MCM1426843.1 flagellin [Eubacterium sp.]
MRINYNASAMRANNALNVTDNKVSSSLRKLSSGLKVNRAKDNPSGYAIGRRMDAQIAGVAVATRNANTGISVIQTADGALTEVHDILQRMNELSVKGSTGTLTSTDRDILNQEIIQLKDEIARIGRDTEFNGQPLLDGSFDLKGYTNNLDVKVGYYSDDVLPKVYTINRLTIGYEDMENGKIDLDQVEFVPGTTLPEGVQFPNGCGVSEVGENSVTITDTHGFKLTLDITPDWMNNPMTLTNITVDVTGIGAMDTQIGANEGQVLGIRIPTISLQRLGLTHTSVITEKQSDDANVAIKSAIMYVSDARSRLGAYQNRLDHTISNLDITSENMTAAYSRIMDVDMAEEMTNYTTQQVVQQAAVSMLAQANERPSQVLQLLQ